MLTFFYSIFSARRELKKILREREYLVAENHELREENIALARRNATTVEDLQDKPEDLETLKTFSERQRLALYNYLTARAYRLNEDPLRKSSLFTRNDLMQATKDKKNVIPFDREVKPKSVGSFLPDVLKDA